MTLPFAQAIPQPLCPANQPTPGAGQHPLESRNEWARTPKNRTITMTCLISDEKKQAHRKRTRGARLSHRDTFIATVSRSIEPTVSSCAIQEERLVPSKTEQLPGSRNEPGLFRIMQNWTTTFAIRVGEIPAHRRRTQGAQVAHHLPTSRAWRVHSDLRPGPLPTQFPHSTVLRSRLPAPSQTNPLRLPIHRNELDSSPATLNRETTYPV
jgi:hypothetical protein